jgi:hypothetical protein
MYVRRDVGLLIGDHILQLYLVFECVGDVAERNGPLYELLQLLSRVGRDDLYPDLVEPKSQVAAAGPDREIRQLNPPFSGCPGDRHSEAGGERGKEDLRGSRSRVISPGLGRLVGNDLKAPHRYPASVALLPVGGDLHGAGQV